MLVGTAPHTNEMPVGTGPYKVVRWDHGTVEAFNPRLHGFAPNPVTAAWNAQQWSF